MPVIVVKNASSGTIQPGTVIKAAKATSTLGSWSGAMPINSLASIPVGEAGRLRLVVGPGAGSTVAKLTASVVAIGLYQTASIAVTGPGSYEWPPGRKAIAALCKSLVFDVAPGGAVSLEFDSYTGLVGTDATPVALGISSRPAGPGLPINIVSAGPARATCSGGWSAGDELAAAANGALRQMMPGESRVAYAETTQSDGDTNCAVTVDLAV